MWLVTFGPPCSMNGYSPSMRIHENIDNNQTKHQKDNQIELKKILKYNNNTKKRSPEDPSSGYNVHKHIEIRRNDRLSAAQ